MISLFSGAGGLDLSVERCVDPPLEFAGTESCYEIALATDCDCEALDTLRANLGPRETLCSDIREISNSEILSVAGLSRGEASLLIGGPPCTPFSKSGFHLPEKRASMDPNSSLLDEYVRVVDGVKPEAFILENVQGLTYSTHRMQFDRLLIGLRSAGYSVNWKVLLAAEFGVPQLRRRVFVIGRRDGKLLSFPESTHSGWSERDRVYDETKLPFITSGQAIKDLLPGEPEPDEIVAGRYADLAATIPPGENYLWHTERGGGQPIWKWRSRYWTFLLRLDPNRPSTTLQAQPGLWVGPYHWENVLDASGRERARRLRLPEILRIMTFPDDFHIPTDRRATFQRQLGNAVPVELGKAVVHAVAEQLEHLPTSRDWK